MELGAEVQPAGSRRASRAVRDLLPVTAAAGATALVVTLVVGGSTSRLDTASLADAPELEVEAPAPPVPGRDVTVRVTPGAGRRTAPAALPDDAGTLFDLVAAPDEPAPTAVLGVVTSAPEGLPRLSFPFRPSGGVVSAVETVAEAAPVQAVAPEPVPPLVEAVDPRRGERPAKSKPVRTPGSTFTTTATTTPTLSLQWSSFSSADSGGGDADADAAAKERRGKARGRVEDPPPDHAQADEKAKVSP